MIGLIAIKKLKKYFSPILLIIIVALQGGFLDFKILHRLERFAWLNRLPWVDTQGYKHATPAGVYFGSNYKRYFYNLHLWAKPH